MQTFLPYADFRKSVEHLDSKRLGKQRVEALQILKATYIPDYGWRNHPAVKMWLQYPESIQCYMNEAIDEWVRRGFNNTMQKTDVQPEEVIHPPWLGDERLHQSHRSNLLRKDYQFYSKYNWTEDSNMPYYWCGYGKGETKERRLK